LARADCCSLGRRESPRVWRLGACWYGTPTGETARRLLLVGADNQAFPIPLTNNAAGQWYFDVPAGKKEILARRPGRNEIAAIYVCEALAQSQVQYFSHEHGDVKQYAQKLISDAGQQNGLYWESQQCAPRSPLGPLVAYASDEGITIKPDAALPYYNYYFRRLNNQGLMRKTVPSLILWSFYWEKDPWA
jgi:Protein of unknown function (DUF2950)